MPTHYSIPQALLRPETGEYLAIGLLMAGEGCPFFGISDEKLKAARELLSPSAARMLAESVRDLTRSFATEYDTSLFETGSSLASWDFLSYSSRYHNNLIRFSAPERITLEANPQNFAQLFKLYVYHSGLSKPGLAEVPSPFRVLKESFYPRIETRVNLEVELTASQIPHLFMPTKVDFIGKNEVPVIGREVLFAKRSYNLGKDLNEMYALIKTVEEDFQKPQVFLVGDEPPKTMTKAHELWANMRKSPFLEVVPIAEVDRIEGYIQEHGVQPFFEPNAV